MLSKQFLEHEIKHGIDSLGEEKEVSVPMCFIFENKKYHGFVPGINLPDIVSSTLEECKIKLLIQTNEVMLHKFNNDYSIPFFPNDEEIKKQFKVAEIVRKVYVKE